jgi:hypothetical protein
MLGAALVTSSIPGWGQYTQYTAVLSSPRQTIDVPDEGGRIRHARFEATAETQADGTARGVALLSQGSEKLEFRFERVTNLVVENGAVRQLVLEGLGTKTSGNVAQEFGFVATIEPQACCQDDLIWDLKDGFVTPDRRFAAQGSVRATASP